MSDCDFDDEDYEFDYSDDEDDEPDVDVENQFYLSKSLFDTNSDDAIESFQKVIPLEAEKGEWGFNALKYIVLLHLQKNNIPEMLAAYKEMLSYTESAVTRNVAEQAVTTLLDAASNEKNGIQSVEALEELYDVTLKALVKVSNDRLWFKTQIKLGKLALSSGDLPKVKRVLKDVYKQCDKLDEEDVSYAGNMMEAHSLDIQVCAVEGDMRRLGSAYRKALSITAAVPHPMTMANICQNGGKMHMTSGEWTEATKAFFQAFKAYDEAGSGLRINCLKYLLLCSMLSESEIDPFDSPEAKPFKTHPEISVMTELMTVYRLGKVDDFEAIIKNNEDVLMNDEFVGQYLNDLRTTIKSQVLQNMVGAYENVSIRHLAEIADLEESQCCHLVTMLIREGKIRGEVDQSTMLLSMDQGKMCEAESLRVLAEWAKSVDQLRTLVVSKMKT